MIARILRQALEQRLASTPAVVLVGPRQVGKTTLARQVCDQIGATYLDLESPTDRDKLSDPEWYLTQKLGELVVLDEVHRMPELFPIVRGRIDEGRRRGIKGGMYLLLGSASIDLIDRSSESLAGRVSYMELHPLAVNEINGDEPDRLLELWSRGGFPDSVLTETDAQSYLWRQAFISTYLEREVPQFAPRRSTQQMRTLWTMMAHLQGQVLNTSAIARSIGTDYKTVQSYLDLLEQLLLIRTVQPWHANVGKRLVKRPKVYIRDSGLLHALLGIRDLESLLGHPVVGPSWEGFVMQQIIASMPSGISVHYYRTSGGAELDIVLNLPGGTLWAIEVKRGIKPSPRRGFHEAVADIKPQRSIVVYAGTERQQLRDSIEVMSVVDLIDELRTATT